MTTENRSNHSDDDGLESVVGDDDEFQEAALFVQNNLSVFSRDDLLYLYARFKQFTIGDVNTSRPGMFSFEARSKWDAWNSLKSMGKVRASDEYIQRVAEVKKKHRIENQKSSNTGPTVSRLLVEENSNQSANQQKTVYEFCQDGDIENVERFLKRKFDVNKPDETQLTLLHWAADRGHTAMIRLLVKYGADLNVRDEDGQTALFYAAHSSSLESIKTLLELGADPNIENNDGELPSSIAESEEEKSVWKRN